jgi:hypothetical protein
MNMHWVVFEFLRGNKHLKWIGPILQLSLRTPQTCFIGYEIVSWIELMQVGLRWTLGWIFEFHKVWRISFETRFYFAPGYVATITGCRQLCPDVKMERTVEQRVNVKCVKLQKSPSKTLEMLTVDGESPGPRSHRGYKSKIEAMLVCFSDIRVSCTLNVYPKGPLLIRHSTWRCWKAYWCHGA